LSWPVIIGLGVALGVGVGLYSYFTNSWPWG